MREAAGNYGEVVDLPYPQIDPLMTPDELRATVDTTFDRILALGGDTVLAAGEFTSLFMLVDRLLQAGIKVLSACSRRETEETLQSDGSNVKTAVFRFEQFRTYEYYEKGRK